MSSEPRTILVIAVPLLGDVLLSTPLIRSVKAKWPSAEIDVITPPGGAAVLEGNPDIRKRFEPPKKPLSAYLGFLFRRFRHYDLVLSNSASDRAVINALVMGRKRISLLDGRHSNTGLKRRLYDYSIEVDYERYHTIVQNLKLIDELEIEKRYDVTLPANPDSGAILTDVLGEGWQGQELAVIHPDTATPFKRWHKTGWQAVVKMLADQGLRVLITGGPSESDREYIEDTLGLTEGPAESLAGKLSLANVAELLAHCRVYVGIDTLISHMAAAAGAPSVIVFGPVSPLTWGPWPRGYEGNGDSPWIKVGSQREGNVSIVQGEKDCVPCGKVGCLDRRDSYSECLDTLEAIRVTDEISVKLGDAAN